MSETNEERIKELHAAAERAWQDSSAAMVRHYEATAEIARLRGDLLAAEFDAALAACYRGEPGATERKDRAYVRLQASRVVVSGDYTGIDEKDHAIVAAEVERLRAEDTQREETARQDS